MEICVIRHSSEHIPSRAQSLNPLARGFLMLSDADSFLRQRCARMRKPNTQEVSPLLTAIAAQSPDHHDLGSPPKSTARRPGQSRRRGCQQQ